MMCCVLPTESKHVNNKVYHLSNFYTFLKCMKQLTRVSFSTQKSFVSLSSYLLFLFFSLLLFPHPVVFLNLKPDKCPQMVVTCGKESYMKVEDLEPYIVQSVRFLLFHKSLLLFQAPSKYLEDLVRIILMSIMCQIWESICRAGSLWNYMGHLYKM